MSRTLISNATIINENRTFTGSVLLENELIKTIYESADSVDIQGDCAEVDATGLCLIPGVIDDQVHFREPGLTHKGDIYTESKAAVAGGVTTYMDMPNTKPPAVTLELLEDKFSLGAEKSFANYSFFMGASNDNLGELRKLDARSVCGVKLFMGSSTGNMLVDNEDTLSALFAEIPFLIAAHCEDEQTIQNNIAYYRAKLGDDIPIQYHPLIRSAEACYKSSSKAVELASKYDARLHILHLSTAKEMSLFDNNKPLREKRITAEVCVHHLWFSDKDYARYGNKIKWNPAIKTAADREALISAVNSNKIDIVATDHAPHLWQEKEGSVLQAASGGPLIQHSLSAMLQLAKEGYFTFEKVIEKMCHAPADLFRIDRRGYIREGYYADLVLVDMNKPYTVSKDNILYKCGWSPFEGATFDASVQTTWVNGQKVFDNGIVDENVRGKRLTFDV
ncbi:dihydroorotase [Paludibacter sp. 221]|uniref:dihydroorotase n=1 Tax=Paludibacter sp. 221 TaxID=2302939 RepID=UPI0013D48A2A|nr:dihydroorotase [Paludibacter sp. 221]